MKTKSSKNKIKQMRSLLTNQYQQSLTNNKKLYNTNKNYIIQMNFMTIQIKFIQYECKIIPFKWSCYNTHENYKIEIKNM